MAAVYSPEHPDVTRLRREIAALEADLGGQGSSDALRTQLEQARLDLASARERYSAEHPDVKRLTSTVQRLEKDLAAAPPPPPVQSTQSPTNPAYIELAARLQAAQAEIRAWREKRVELQDRVKLYEARVMRTPQVERENRALLREYESTLAKYEDIKAKQAEAELGESMEMELKGEQFTLVEPPLLPEQPVKPNRIGLLLLGAVLSLAGGVGTAAVAESLDTTIHGRGDVFRALGVAPLAAIPEIITRAQRRTRKRRQFAAVAVGVGLMVLGLYLVHTLVIPVDLLWYSVLRNLSV
jgi:uncharacterized protein involved in exopolysaccharide biosynthesis